MKPAYAVVFLWCPLAEETPLVKHWIGSGELWQVCMRSVDGWEVDSVASLVSRVQLLEEPVEEVAVAQTALEFRDLLDRDGHFLRMLGFQGVAFPREAEAALVEIDCGLAGLGLADEGFPVQAGPVFQSGDMVPTGKDQLAPVYSILLFISHLPSDSSQVPETRILSFHPGLLFDSSSD